MSENKHNKQRIWSKWRNYRIALKNNLRKIEREAMVLYCNLSYFQYIWDLFFKYWANIQWIYSDFGVF